METGMGMGMAGMGRREGQGCMYGAEQSVGVALHSVFVWDWTIDYRLKGA